MVKAIRWSWTLGLAFLGLLAALVWAQTRDDLGAPGPYLAGWRTVTVTRPNNSTFSARLYYPATSQGLNAPIDPSGAPYPAITFGHGFLQAVTQYDSTLRHLATRGYIVIASESEGGLFPNHANFALDLRHCLTWLEQQNTHQSSFLAGRVATDRFGASGHSMGGGASILAAAADGRIKALANLAAAETNPSAIAAMPNVQAPVALIAGSRDTITPPANHQVPMYNNGLPPKQLPNIIGGFHCGFVDSSFFGCDSGTISRAEQLLMTRRQLTAFFNLYLKKDQSVWSRVWGPEMKGDPAVQTTYDAGVVVSPESQTRTVPRGSGTTYEFTVTNVGRGPDSYAIQISGNRWPMILLNSSTPTLQVGQSAVVRVAFTGFVVGGGATQDTVVVSARSGRDGVTRAFGTATTVLQ
jgi:dienelactone hydrolase